MTLFDECKEALSEDFHLLSEDEFNKRSWIFNGVGVGYIRDAFDSGCRFECCR